MSVSVAAKSAPITTISKFRALFLVLAAQKGWKHSQVLTNVDSYTKGNEVITVKWGATSMVEFTHTKGKSLDAHVTGGVGSKLQKLQTRMGSPIADNQKWAKLPTAKVKELEALATTTFKVVEPKA